jgi:hypothetical protein
VIAILSEYKELVNITRPGGSSLYAPLHQAAHDGSSTDIVLRPIELGAWRTLQNARGERAVDVAEKRGHSHPLDALAPQLKRRVPVGVLLKIQAHFHAVICGRTGNLVQQHGLRLPELEPLLEFDDIQVRFPS